MLAELGVQDDPLLEVAMELERIALTDEYFIEKKLYPNIDFYSGITLKALGFPTTMFTVLFAVARTVGWIAQWKEMVEDPSQKIGRPRQLYTGASAARLRADLQAPLGRAAASAKRRSPDTAAAALTLGVASPESIRLATRSKAASWAARSGLSRSSGNSAAASRSGSLSASSNSGIAFSPRIRLASTIDLAFSRIA